jgi:signal transduction histidine kinase
VAYVVDDTAAYRLSSDQPGKALEAAQRVLMMSESTFSKSQKVLFFRRLSVMFENSGHFKEALSCLKTADSLEALKDVVPVQKTQEKQATTRWPVYLFYMMLLVFLLLLVYIFYGMKGRAKLLKTQKYERDDLISEHQNLREELEERINEENRELQQQLDELKQQELTLKTALQKVEKASYLRNAFIANLGFDVRTPLNSIIGFANMLETELAVQENKELYDFASSIAESGNRLLKLLNNVIDLSSLEAHAMNVKQKPVSLAVVMQKVFQQYTEQAKDKGLVFKMKAESDLPPVLADERALEKVLEQIM